MIPPEVKKRISREINEILGKKKPTVNKLDIGVDIDLPFIDNYASKLLPHDTTLLLRESQPKGEYPKGY